jgi:hypothetical protein
MGRELDSVCHKVTHVWVVVLHVNLAAQSSLALLVATRTHLLKFSKVPLNGVVTSWRVQLVLPVV